MLKLLVIAVLCTSSDAITPPKSKLNAPSKTINRGGGAMTETQATVSLFKTIVGGGILALPAGMAAGRGTGVLPGLLILALHAGASAYTYSLVGRSVAKTLAELWAAAFGKQTSWIIDLIIVGVAGGA